MDIYEVIWKTLFVIKAVEQTKNENFFELVSAANDAYTVHESGLTMRAADEAYCTPELHDHARRLGHYQCYVCKETLRR